MEKQPKSRRNAKSSGDRSRKLKMSKSGTKASPSKSPPQQIQPEEFLCLSECKQHVIEAYTNLKHHSATFKPGGVRSESLEREDDDSTANSENYYSLAGTDAENSMAEEEEDEQEEPVLDSPENAGRTEEADQHEKSEQEMHEPCKGDCVDQAESPEEIVRGFEAVDETGGISNFDTAQEKLDPSADDMDLSNSTVEARILGWSGSAEENQSLTLAEQDSSLLLNTPRPDWPDSSSDFLCDSPSTLFPAVPNYPFLENEDSHSPQLEPEIRSEAGCSKESEILPSGESDDKNLDSKIDLNLATAETSSNIQEIEESCRDTPREERLESNMTDEDQEPAIQANMETREAEKSVEEKSKPEGVTPTPENEASLRGDQTQSVDMELSDSLSPMCEPTEPVPSLKRPVSTPSPRDALVKSIKSTPELRAGKIPKLITRCSTPKARSHSDTPQPKSQLPRLTRAKYNKVKAKVDSNLSGNRVSILKKQTVQEQPKSLEVSWKKPIDVIIIQEQVSIAAPKEPEVQEPEETPELKNCQTKEEETLQEEEFFRVEKEPKALLDEKQREAGQAEFQVAPQPEKHPRGKAAEKNNGKVLLGVAAAVVVGYAAYSNWDTIVKKSETLLKYLAPR